MDLVAKLNDRNLSFPDRCIIAASLLKPSSEAGNKDTWLFPRKNQFLFDWLTGSLLKLARSESPRPEIFLNTSVWELLKIFANVLECKQQQGGSFKRPLRFITDDDEFFDFTKSFDSNVFVIKCPLLTIFQTALSLLNRTSEDAAEPEMICSVILAFVHQTRVSLPVSFSQVTDFIRSLVRVQSNLPPVALTQILCSTLAILSEIVLGGAANYKKTYGLLVKFCLEAAGSENDKELWIEFIKTCLFSQEFVDELLIFITSPAMIAALNDPKTIINESTFPKSLTFQKTLFVELASETTKAFASCPVIFEAFLRAVGPKINRETGFNFFTFLLRKTLPHCSTAAIHFTQLAKLISILQARGNEIYQQRNDQIYRDQSAVIEEIFNSALEVDVTQTPFPLLLSLAKLNYYLVADRLPFILSRLRQQELTLEVVEFVVGMFELASLANQLAILLEIILKSNLPLPLVADQKLQSALIRIFQNNLSPLSLHQIYLSLTKEPKQMSALSMVLLVPIIRSIAKVVDNVESFDKNVYAALQRQLITTSSPESLNLLVEIVRWTPGTILLIEELFTLHESASSSSVDILNLVFTLKCKEPVKIKCNSLEISNNLLLLKYLPIIAQDLSSKQCEAFCTWLLEHDKNICISTLKMVEFYEIKTLQEPFLNQLVQFIINKSDCNDEYVAEIVSLLPWEYVNDKVVAELIKTLWRRPVVVSQLLRLPSPLNVRVSTIKSLVSSDIKSFVDFLFVYKEDSDDFVSKCFQAEHSSKLIKSVLVKLKSEPCALFKIEFIAKMLKFADFENSELISFIETEINPIKMLKSAGSVSVAMLDALDIILEWIVDYRMEMVAGCILALPTDQSDLLVAVRAQALKCKFPARTDVEFINESVNLASKLSADSPVAVTFKKDLLSLIKELPCDTVRSLLESFLLNHASIWKFSLGLQALNQLVHLVKHVPSAFSIFNDNLDTIYSQSLKFNLIPSFLAVLKSFVQLKKNVSWDSHGIANILGVLRKARQAQPQSYEEVFVTLRLISTLHLRQCRALLPLLVSNVCEAFAEVSSVDEATALGRVLSELGSLRRGELEPFALLPILHTFISTKFSSSALRKPLQLAMNSVMYHLGSKKALLQLLSTALVVDHEHRVILKSFIEEFNKFHKYSGRA